MGAEYLSGRIRTAADDDTDEHSENKEAKKELLQYADPYVCKSANLTAMEFVYDKLKPQLYIGRSFTDSLERKGIFGIDSMPGQDVLGFAGCFGLLKRLLDFTQTQIEEK